MTDHKFEPFQKVLVRGGMDCIWGAAHFSRIAEGCHSKFVCTSDIFWSQCIPYTPETAHLLGTSQPYEPPKPPQEYEWGQKVEVMETGTSWGRGIWLKRAENPECPQQHLVAHEYGLCSWYKENQIRPLPDSAAHADD